VFSGFMKLPLQLTLIWPVLACGLVYSPAMFAEPARAGGPRLVYIGEGNCIVDTRHEIPVQAA